MTLFLRSCSEFTTRKRKGVVVVLHGLRLLRRNILQVLFRLIGWRRRLCLHNTPRHLTVVLGASDPMLNTWFVAMLPIGRRRRGVWDGQLKVTEEASRLEQVLGVRVHTMMSTSYTMVHTYWTRFIVGSWTVERVKVCKLWLRSIHPNVTFIIDRGCWSFCSPPSHLPETDRNEETEQPPFQRLCLATFKLWQLRRAAACTRVQHICPPVSSLITLNATAKENQFKTGFMIHKV